jgi:hypothetical protein
MSFRAVAVQLLNEVAQGTGAVNGDKHPAPGSKGVIITDVTVEGGTATLDIDIEGYDAPSGKWTTIQSLTQRTAVGTYRELLSADLLDAEIRAVGTIGGTTPTMTYTCSIHMK